MNSQVALRAEPKQTMTRDQVEGGTQRCRVACPATLRFTLVSGRCRDAHRSESKPEANQGVQHQANGCLQRVQGPSPQALWSRARYSPLPRRLQRTGGAPLFANVSRV
jgi:hypothetical protein